MHGRLDMFANLPCEQELTQRLHATSQSLLRAELATLELTARCKMLQHQAWFCVDLSNPGSSPVPASGPLSSLTRAWGPGHQGLSSMKGRQSSFQCCTFWISAHGFFEFHAQDSCKRTKWKAALIPKAVTKYSWSCPVFFFPCILMLNFKLLNLPMKVFGFLFLWLP